MPEDQESPRRLRIEVPATASLGVGALGLALGLSAVVRADFGADDDAVTGDERLVAAYRSFPAQTLPAATLTVEQHIPAGVGLGEDVALTVAGLVAAAEATRAKDAQSQILQIAALSTKDPIRTSVAVFGGVATGFTEGQTTHAAPVVSHLALRVVLFIPDATTHRSVSPIKADPARLAYVIATLTWGRWDLIGAAMQDAPEPTHLAPNAASVLSAAGGAGAYAATTSGPTILALCREDDVSKVAAAMETRAREMARAGRSLTTCVNEGGVHVTPEKETQAQPESPDHPTEPAP